MRSLVTWSDTRVDHRDDSRAVIYDIAFKPDGTEFVVACGTRVYVYDAIDGDLLHQLRGHKDTVYCVSYAKDGKRFASGGADSTIIIWTSKAEGILKYKHNDPIQALEYNPVTQQLASCTASDFGLWSPEQKAVPKTKMPSKVLCCAWTNDGQFLALGQQSGQISIRDREGKEKVQIQRGGPVWCLQWNPSKDEQFDILAVGSWDQCLSFYQMSGRQVGKDRDIGFDPCSLGYFTNGEYIVMSGSGRKVHLYTKEGVHLNTIVEREDWVWACKARPKQNYIAFGTNDGSVGVCQLIFSTTHGLYQDRYAYRELMTDVIIQHLITEQKVRIKCRDYVKKIAIYKDRLAVQLPSQIIVYELFQDDAYDMHYRIRDRIQEKLECNLLVVTSQHLILCQEKRLQLLDFKGSRMRDWNLEAVIRYIKVVGGPPGREGLLVGLKNGAIYKIFIDNQFPISLIKLNTSVRCLDLSASRTKLAVVDETSDCSVYDLATKELLFREPNANSLAWNTEVEDMLCFSGNGILSIKTNGFPVHQQKLQGFVVGFKGSKIFCLHYVAMQTIDVPQSASVYRYIEKRDFPNAYKIACLGVTERDWRVLATEALAAMNFDVARKAFIRLKDLRYLELIMRLEQERQQGNNDPQLFLGEVLAHQGKFLEAARVFTKGGHVQKAINMFMDLRQWEEAKKFVAESDINVNELLRRQAEWMEETGDLKSAAEMYVGCGEVIRAIKLLGDNSMTKELADVSKGIQKGDTKALELCLMYLTKLGDAKAAQQVIMKMGDNKELLKLYISLQQWDDAFALAEAHPELGADIHLPYANWLAINDRFDEAQEAFKRAGRPEDAVKLLDQLTHNAVSEHRFSDAAYYFWLLSMEKLKMVEAPARSRLTPQEEELLDKHRQFAHLADIYFMYHSVHRYTEEPFTSMESEALFNISRVLLVGLEKETPFGLSRMYILFTLAKLAHRLGGYKLSRTAFAQLQDLRVPPSWIDQIDSAALAVRSKPFSDKEDLNPVCYRCSSVNPLLGRDGNVCTTCGHPFVFSYHSFDVLPLVEFHLEDGITDEEAERLIDLDIGPSSRKKAGGDGTGTVFRDGAEVMTLTDNIGTDEDPTTDEFTQLMSQFEVDGTYPVITVNRDVLRTLSRNEVFVKKWPSPSLRSQYYKHLIPEMPITLCHHCNHFFNQEDFEASVLITGACPYCRQKADLNK